jgi:hypothetical protein
MFLRPAFWFGVGAVVVYEFLPQIAKALRPVIVQGMKAGMGMADQMKTSGSGARETFQDMMAEARSEYEAEKTASVGQDAQGPSTGARAKKADA